MNLKVRLSRSEAAETTVEGNDLVMLGQLFRGDEQTGMKFMARVRVLADGGKMAVSEGGFEVRDADAVTLLLAARTDFRDADFQAKVAKELDAAAGRSYDELRRRHVADFHGLFSRVTIDLGDSEGHTLPTDRRLLRFASGEADPGLAALYFQLGRYLLDLQLAARRHGGESARHLGRGDHESVELRLPREHQCADELLARGDDESRRSARSRWSI